VEITASTRDKTFDGFDVFLQSSHSEARRASDNDGGGEGIAWISHDIHAMRLRIDASANSTWRRALPPDAMFTDVVLSGQLGPGGGKSTPTWTPTRHAGPVRRPL
jgi:hypothetical protein